MFDIQFFFTYFSCLVLHDLALNISIWYYFLVMFYLMHVKLIWPQVAKKNFFIEICLYVQAPWNWFNNNIHRGSSLEIWLHTGHIFHFIDIYLLPEFANIFFCHILGSVVYLADLHHEINRVSAVSRCLNIKFPRRNCSHWYIH